MYLSSITSPITSMCLVFQRSSRRAMLLYIFSISSNQKSSFRQYESRSRAEQMPHQNMALLDPCRMRRWNLQTDVRHGCQTTASLSSHCECKGANISGLAY